MKTIPLAAALAGFLALSGCQTGIGYVWREAGPFLKSNSGARPIDQVLKDPKTPQDVRTLLEEVKSIKNFAVHAIGLKDNSNYTRYKALDRDYLVTVVQACGAVSFTPYEWRYPFLGKLPYRGYYDPKDADGEAAALKAKGYDVIVRKVDAFSTLGFFSDPVYSFMKDYSAYDLADTIIHEQTHATIFLKGQDQFNEELASFVGDTGGLEYVQMTYGRESPQYGDAVAEQEDSAIFLDFINNLRARLQAVYGSDLSREEMLARKAEIIRAALVEYREKVVPLYKSKAYKGAVDLPINNAYISLFDLYTKDIPLLREYYRSLCGSDLAVFIKKVKEISRSSKDMAQSLRAALSAAG